MPGKSFSEIRGLNVVRALIKNDFQALYVSSRELALEELLKRVPEGATVGLGGSVTIREIGLIEALRAKMHMVYDHWDPRLSEKEKLEVRKHHLNAGVFVSGCNAITLDGKLVNVDASGNRVAAMIFGPNKVIIVAGVNKVVKNLDEAITRIKNVAAPKNCLRRNDPNPCTNTTFCMDCNSVTRLCRVTTIIEKKPWATQDFTVIVIGEEIGF